MKNPKIAQKSPVVIDTKTGTYYFCTCGESKKQPFCDDSHTGSEFVPEKTEVKEDGKVAWCACKYSKNGAFCDGTHRDL